MSEVKLNMAYATIRKMESELAALREELVSADRSAETLHEVIIRLKSERDAAEQRNAQAVELLEIWQTWLGSSRESCNEQGKQLWDRIEVVTKPTESGASE